MKSKGMLSVVIVAAALAAFAGCKGSEEVAKTDTPPPPPGETPSATGSAAPAGDVANYPTQIAMGGTVLTSQTVKVYQAADPASTVLTTLGPGTLVETKARYGEWMLINWPSGVSKLSPGWVMGAYLGAPKVVVDAGVVDSGTTPAPDAGSNTGVNVMPTPSATPSTTPSAAPSTTSTGKIRPVIRLPVKKP